MDLIQAGALWLHALATVILLGYYALLALLILPVLRRTLAGPSLGAAIGAIERRALPLVVGAVAVFLVTGGYLMLTDTRYGGLGDFFGTSWAILILVKHAVVLVMVGIGVYVDLLVVPDVALAATEPDRDLAMHRLATAANAMTLLGALVLLLTAAAQAS